MDPQEVLNEILDKCFPRTLSIEDIQARDLLFAHYTSLDVLRNILMSDEIWFSSPVFMNDRQELEYGVEIGIALIQQSASIRQLFPGDPALNSFQFWLGRFINEFRIDHSFNIYVFCMSEHEKGDVNGILSMWRAYGQNGQGGALVFNSAFLKKGRDSPILIAPVQYAASHQRKQVILQLIEDWCSSIKSISADLQNEKILAAVVQALFIAIKVLALTIKDAGFSEEREWRLIYMPDQDAGGRLAEYFSYHIDSNGIAPKLKLPVKPLDPNKPDNWTFDEILPSIIFGPGISYQRHGGAIKRLLAECKKSSFLGKVQYSLIPLRYT